MLARCLAALSLAATLAHAAPPEGIGEAHAAAARDDHETAIRLFREAIAADPSMRDSVSVALASQLTWIGRYDEAIDEFHWFLDRHPERVDARLTLGLAQSWSDRPKEALETYREILRQDGSQIDAALGEARMLAWLGDNRAAARLYSRVIDTDPASIVALEGRAVAWNWAGLPRRALADIDRLRTVVALPPSAADLEAAILLGRAPVLRLSADTYRDSDDFEWTAYRIEGSFDYDLRSRLRIHAVANRFEKPTRVAAEDLWVGLGFDARPHDDLILYGSVQALATPPTGVEGSRGTGDIHAAWLRGDRLRFDAGYARSTFFTYERSPDGTARYVDADFVDLGVSLRPLYHTTILGGADQGWYADGNRRLHARIRARQAIFLRPRVWVELGGQWLDYDEPIARGLWTPLEFRSLQGAAEIEWAVGSAVTLFGRADGGWARERGMEAAPYLAGTAGLRATRGALSFETRLGRADSNVESGRGYRRAFGSLSASIRL